MSRVLPILFNTEMAQAILDDRKTVTRRVVKQSIWKDFVCEEGKVENWLDKKTDVLESPTHKAPFQEGDILYVRETWAFAKCITCNGEYRHKGSPAPCYDFQAVEYDDGDSISDGCFIYRADHPHPERITWRPSIHMPKAAARIWLKVTDVRVERLQEITKEQAIKEGAIDNRGFIHSPENEYDNIHSAREHFMKIWDSTTKKSERDLYGWDANPWVWVIEFKRCEKPEEG